ncbi:NAD(P)H-binding protein [Streptomyces sp. NPDC003077]|uniref:SDR family oxidoreductase n=1 Tax=Streptomyces sp. NPDC003077 TaxID=3154443 RepID=UPI0033A72E84
MATILVTGGTGTLGRVLIDRLRTGDHEVRSLSRRAHAAPPRPGVRMFAADLRQDAAVHAETLTEAVTGADVIVHCASTPTGGDVPAAGRLLAAAQAAQVPHLLYISIVGVDRVPFRYYRAKLEVERLLEESKTGWTVLRTTQFHDLVLRVVKAGARSPVLPVPAGVRIQPIDVREVADRMAELAIGEPSGRVPDMGGPEVRTARDLARATLRAGGRRRLLAPLWLPGPTFRAFQAGGHLAPERAVGRTTYEEFLAERVPREAAVGAS